MAVEEVDVVALSFGLFVCIYGVVSYLIKERLYIGEAPLAFLLGIFLGPSGIGQLTDWDGEGEDVVSADKVALSLSRVVIGTQLVLVGIQLPRNYLFHELRSLSVLLLPVMTLMWLITAGLIQLVIPDVPFLVALVVAACTTPTDPVLSNAIVKGAFADQYVPARLRNLISAESGCNDGLAYPFLYIAIRLVKAKGTPHDVGMSVGEALTKWLLIDCLYVVGGAFVLGIVVGLAANRALRFGCKHNYIDKESFLLFGPMIGLTTVGLAGMLDLDDLLAAFIAGNAFTYDDWYRQETEEDEVQNVLDFLLNSIFFAFAGAAVPFNTFSVPEWGTSPWRLLLLAVLVLALRRLPPMLAMYKFIPAMKDHAEAAFVGYFGPIGAGAIFYASLILHEFPLEEVAGTGGPGERVRQLIRPVCFSLVLASLLGHTLAIPLVKVAFNVRGVRQIQLKETADAERESLADAEEEQYEEGEQPDAPESQHHGADVDVERGDAAYEPPSSTHRQDEALEAAEGVPADMTQTPSSQLRPGLVSRPSTTLRFRRADVEAAYRQGAQDREGSWRHSTGHKLGPHVAAEREERARERREHSGSGEH